VGQHDAAFNKPHPQRLPFEVIRFSAQTSGHQRDLRSPDFIRHTE